MIYVETGAVTFESADEEQAKIVTHLNSAYDWEILETLLWVEYRDIEIVAARIRTWREQAPNLFRLYETVNWIEHIRIILHTRPWPDERLHAALTQGIATASGRHLTSTGRMNISPYSWTELKLVHANTYEEERVSATLLPIVATAPRWTHIKFDREKLSKAFTPLKRKVSKSDITTDLVLLAVSTVGPNQTAVAREIVRVILGEQAAMDIKKVGSVRSMLHPTYGQSVLEKLQAKVSLHPNLQSGLQS